MKRFAIALLATRAVGRDVNVNAGVYMVEAADALAAEGVGHRILRSSFPPDAFGNWQYHVEVCPADAEPVTAEGLMVPTRPAGAADRKGSG